MSLAVFTYLRNPQRLESVNHPFGFYRAYASTHPPILRLLQHASVAWYAAYRVSAAGLLEQDRCNQPHQS